MRRFFLKLALVSPAAAGVVWLTLFVGYLYNVAWVIHRAVTMTGDDFGFQDALAAFGLISAYVGGMHGLYEMFWS